MTVTTNPQMLRDIEAAMVESANEGNPFVRDGDETYMRHDEVRITYLDGFVEVAYRWRDVIQMTQMIPCDLVGGQVLTLAGVQGRMLVREL